MPRSKYSASKCEVWSIHVHQCADRRLMLNPPGLLAKARTPTQRQQRSNPMSAASPATPGQPDQRQESSPPPGISTRCFNLNFSCNSTKLLAEENYKSRSDVKRKCHKNQEAKELEQRRHLLYCMHDQENETGPSCICTTLSPRSCDSTLPTRHVLSHFFADEKQEKWVKAGAPGLAQK